MLWDLLRPRVFSLTKCEIATERFWLSRGATIARPFAAYRNKLREPTVKFFPEKTAQNLVNPRTLRKIFNRPIDLK